MAKIIFDDLKSHWHAVIGFFSAFLLVFSIGIIAIYIWYQRQEKETIGFTLGDLIEFLVGYVYGLAVLIWLIISGVV